MEPITKPKRTRVEKKKDGEPREVIIYKIEIDGTNFLYVGHTEDFDQREYNHKKACQHNLLRESKNHTAHSPLYCEINRNGGWGKAKMSPMEKFISTGKLESRIKEQHWIDKIQVARRDAVMMNACRAYCSPEEIKSNAAEYYAEYHVKHRVEHNAKNLARNLKRMTCICGREITVGSKSKHLKTAKHNRWVVAEDQKFADRLDKEMAELLEKNGGN